MDLRLLLSQPIIQSFTVTAVNLSYEVLPKQFEAFGFYVSHDC